MQVWAQDHNPLSGARLSARMAAFLSGHKFCSRLAIRTPLASVRFE
jgi:hypothetical protein